MLSSRWKSFHDTSCQWRFSFCEKSNDMRKIVLGLAVSIEGFIEGPRGEFDWCFTDQDYGMAGFLKNVDAILYGRKSYEVMMGMEGGNPFANIKGYVFSNTMKNTPEGFELVSGDIIAKVRSLKTEPGKNIWLFGGASLTTSLMNEDLVDELWLSIHPILLGAGKPFLHDLKKRTQLQLLETQSYSTGLLSVKYKVINKTG